MNRVGEEVGLLSVNVAEPEIIGARHGDPVLSSIRKRPVVGVETLTLERDGLRGNLQADLVAHGGPEKAVYVYPSEHLPLWNAEQSRAVPFGPGTFGENLTIRGWLEHDARIGDVWAWGDARLQICQPRYPCYKLAMATEWAFVIKRMLETRRNGWYLRVLETGEVPVAGPITVVERGDPNATVIDAVIAFLPGASTELIERVAAVEALASRWRNALLEKLALAEQ